MTSLTEAQLDGRACIQCGREEGPKVPVGFLNRVQVFRCSPACPDGTRANDPIPSERRAEPGELCTCGRPAVVVYLTQRWGPVGFCGLSGVRPVMPCPFCGSPEPHLASYSDPQKCPKYRLHPLQPAAWPAIVPPLQWNQDFTPSLREPYCARVMTVDGRATWWTVSHCVHCDEWPRDWPTHCAYECPHREDVADA